MLHHPWETMCWITPGKLCVASALGNYVLSALILSFWVPQPWFPALVRCFGPLFSGRQGPRPIGPVCVASPLEHYVLHQLLETMCCIALRRRWSCMTHHDDDHYHHDRDHHRCSWQTCAKKSEGLGRVGFYFSKFEAPLGYFSKYFGS